MNKLMKSQSYNSIRKDIFVFLEDYSHKNILDIGCYRGMNAEYLKSKYSDIKYVGIEYDSDAVKNMSDAVDEIYNIDIDNLDIKIFNEEKFDIIILADIIEHLKDPGLLLEKLMSILKDDGLVLVSIPNVQYYETFWLLLFGRFPRRDRGIFDKTHLRWFTLKEAKLLFERYFLIKKFTRKYRIVEGEYLHSLNRLNVIFKPLFWLFKPFFTHQYLFALKKRN